MKLLSFLFILVVFSIDSFAHGPSRQKVIKKIEINAPADKVWDLVSNFSDFSWHTNLIEQKSSGNVIGSVRDLVFKNDKKIKHSLEKLNSEKKLISWRIVESDSDLMPVNSYSATLKVDISKESANKTTLTYKSAFYRGFMGNDPPEDLNDENSKKKVIDFVDKAIEGLKNKFN